MRPVHYIRRSSSRTLALEPRLLFDGAAMVAAQDAINTDDGDAADPSAAEHELGDLPRSTEASQTVALIDARLPQTVERIIIANKIDLAGLEAGRVEENGVVRLQVSAKKGAGMELVRAELLRIAGWQAHGEDVILARERHLHALRAALAHIGTAASQSAALELFAEELRLAQDVLGEITGEFSADDLLGVIFSRFCIGK